MDKYSRTTLLANSDELIAFIEAIPNAIENSRAAGDHGFAVTLEAHHQQARSDTNYELLMLDYEFTMLLRHRPAARAEVQGRA